MIYRIYAFMLLAMLCAAPILAAAAEPNDKTPCIALRKVLDVDVPERDRILPSRIYMENTLEVMDENHTANGEPGILAPLSDAGLTNILALIATRCHNNVKMTIYSATSEVYRGVRDLQMTYGIAK